MRAAVVAVAALFIPACSTLPVDSDRVAGRSAPDPCNSEGGETSIGQPVTADLGAQIIALTDATSLRWIPPDVVVTKEYVYGRVSVSYDGDMRITDVTCG